MTAVEDGARTPDARAASGDPRRVWPISVTYVARGPLGGTAPRSLLERVAQECGRQLPRRIQDWPAGWQVGDPRVTTEGEYMPALAGWLIRDDDGRPLRLPSVAEAAHLAELWLLAAPVVSVWVRVGAPSRHGDPGAWARGVAGARIGVHPALERPVRLTHVIGSGRHGEASPDTAIWPRVITGGTTT